MYIGTKPQSGFITTAKQRVTSSTNNYVDLDHSISSLSDCIVWVNFVKQDSTNLTLTTSTRITLGATLVASDIVEIAYLGKAVATQTPSSGTVTNDMLAGSIANSKLATDPLNASNLASGTVPTARLGSGTASSSTFLRGDSTFQTISSETSAPVFKAHLNSAQNIPNTTEFKMPLGVEDLDTGGCYDTTNYRFTPNVAGWYLFIVSGLLYYGNSAGEYGDIAVWKNGSKAIGNRNSQSGNMQLSESLRAVGVIHMNGSSDYVEPYIYHQYGTGKDLDSNEDYTYFTGFRITGSV